MPIGTDAVLMLTPTAFLTTAIRTRTTTESSTTTTTVAQICERPNASIDWPRGSGHRRSMIVAVPMP
jgi:hypothetical protein